MKLRLILFVCLGFSVINYAQTNQPKYIAEAVKLYESGKYFEAMPKLEAAYNKMTNKGKDRWPLNWPIVIAKWNSTIKPLNGTVRASS
jgi:hypothetical protein